MIPRRISTSSSTAPKDLLITAATVMLLLVPFLGKAFHIDDTLFLETAEHIRKNPLNFYGFSFNWYGYAQQMWDINQNPPLASYFLAGVSLVAGWSEIALHTAFLLPALAFAIGVYLLAGHFCHQPLLATLLAILSPVFAISATNVMSDVLMCAFYVWALYLWLKGIEQQRHALLGGAALCISLGFLSKYFAATAIPLLFVYTVGRERNISPRLAYLILPLLVITGYEWLTTLLYGQGLLAKAFLYPSTYRAFSWTLVPEKTLTGLSFTGGCAASALFLLPMARGRKSLWPVLAGVLTMVVLLLLAKGGIANLVLRSPRGIDWGKLLQLGLWITLGGYLLALSCLDLYRNRDTDSLFLFLWVFGTFTFSVFINWTVNGRTLLPMLPALTILQTRLLPWLRGNVLEPFSDSSHKLPPPTLAYMLIPAFFLAFTTTLADTSLANVQRTAASSILRDIPTRGPKIWFQGHWGFQYYMEQQGAQPLDFEKIFMSSGDFLLLPDNNTNVEPPFPACWLVKEYSYPTLSWLTTMVDAPVGAGFYADAWGPLPFAFGPVPPQAYYLLACGSVR